MNINGKTKILGIFGNPIEHTLSPIIFNSVFKKLKLNYVYVPFEINPKNLKNAVNSLKMLNIYGINVTMPYKQTIIKYLDKISPIAKKINSVNTIVNINGKLIGYNTDTSGFIADLQLNGINPKNKTVLLLGAGGAGQAIAFGLSEAKKIYVIDINIKRVKNITSNIKNTSQLPFLDYKKISKEIDIIINTTPIGMNIEDPSILSLSLFNKNIFVYDIIYNRETKLLKLCKKFGIKCTNGLGMLLNQASISFELLTGKKISNDIIKNIMRKI